MARGASGGSTAGGTTDGRPGTTNLYGKRLGGGRNVASPTGMSVADQNFGQNKQNMLPNVGDNKS